MNETCGICGLTYQPGQNRLAVAEPKDRKAGTVEGDATPFGVVE